ncbi:MAG TPA: UbiA family prenyltransferase [Longimicrobiaceae bacterium]
MKISERLLPYLRLVRAPAVFSAVGDPLTGMLVASGRLSVGRAAGVVLASASTYLAGMALNDVADREEDARERPERPIPSGAVGVGQAAALGAGLLGLGLMLARSAGARRTGPALAASVLAYNFALKRTTLGPAAMGACRALSLLTGAEAAARGGGLRRGLGAAAILGGYVAGLTVLARGETEETGNRTPLPGVVVGGAALAAAAVRGGRRALPWTIAAAALAGGAVRRAVAEPGPAAVGPAVGSMIRAIPALDAALAAPRSPGRSALIFPPLLALVRWGRKLIPIS